MWRVIYSVNPRTPEGGQAGKGDKPPSLHILCFRGAHTQLLLATPERRKIVTDKGRNDERRMTNDEGNTEEISTLRKGIARQAN